MVVHMKTPPPLRSCTSRIGSGRTSARDLARAVTDYHGRERRFGRVRVAGPTGPEEDRRSV
jgi:hypothetical protein